VNGTTYDVSGYAVGEPTELVAYIGEQRFTGTVARDYANNTYSVFCDQEKGMKHAYPLQVPALDLGDDEGTKGKLAIKTPMPGSVIKVMVSAGDVVEKGAPLMILTAMKMEHIIRAQMDGTIESVGFNEGDFVEDGKILISFVDDEADD
jgi:3-methylcrotonyl-CoA carboxylase alpha subunit